MNEARLVKFSKPSGILFEHKKNFLNQDDKYLEREREIAKIYAKQPERKECKNCGKVLGGEVAFVKIGVPYKVCNVCTHLNGGYEDTAEFCNEMYIVEAESYAMDYDTESQQAYALRVKDIYVPKAEFLRESLSVNGENVDSLQYADFGAGAGYFVAALKDIGIESVEGYEVSDALIKLATAFRPELKMELHDLDKVVDLAKEVKADVVSMIGVLEHVREPRKVLAALKENPNVKYLYFSVPMYSPSVFIELAFPDVLQRHLSGEHTHLFSDTSIEYFSNENGFERISEWWFGADMMDFYRSLMVTVGRSGSEHTLAEINKMIVPLIDKLQSQIDQSKVASEVHMLLKVK